jgi:hypothetical protein
LAAVPQVACRGAGKLDINEAALYELQARFACD